MKFVMALQSAALLALVSMQIHAVASASFIVSDPHSGSVQQRIDELHRNLNELHRQKMEKFHHPHKIVSPIVPANRKPVHPYIPIANFGLPYESVVPHHQVEQFYHPRMHPFPLYPYLAPPVVAESRDYLM